MGSFYALATLAGLTVLVSLLGLQHHFVAAGIVYGVVGLGSLRLWFTASRWPALDRLYFISLFLGCTIVSIGLLGSAAFN
jgi:hypothetical protein